MIIKLSSSGKQVQVVDDEGNVFGTSLTFMKGLFEGKARSGFILMTRMPFKVNKNRWKPSPVYVPDTGEKELYEEHADEERNQGDIYSKTITKKVKQKKAYEDKIVW